MAGGSGSSQVRPSLLLSVYWLREKKQEGEKEEDGEEKAGEEAAYCMLGPMLKCDYYFYVGSIRAMREWEI